VRHAALQLGEVEAAGDAEGARAARGPVQVQGGPQEGREGVCGQLWPLRQGVPGEWARRAWHSAARGLGQALPLPEPVRGLVQEVHDVHGRRGALRTACH